ncbi:collagen-like protein [Maribacter sp. PR1]|uniref:Collagen-like protein n=1 Tax=Maribacter cobaltidurans TaxID=1178778 RepID=A0ABU7IWN5_9FLAO|nr:MULTISPECIES: collagen-like protein [Maribacter]MDC6389982.1 collagen-like protein [Maribacter sp. PR1]MEE1977372.1 collagen-like protein [Maribacter cobaltidurans]
MKKITILFSAMAALFFISCEGPQGPPGYDGLDGLDGLDGQDGVNILGQVVDIQGTFTAEDNYSIFYEFPQSIEVFETDVVLVYLLWDQTEDGNGDPVDIWRLMPQTRIIDQGLLQYNYDYTFFDVNIFLESDFDLSTLLPGDTDDQVFRIAILPADAAQTGKLDVSDINSVMNRLGVTENDVQKVILK